MTDDRDLRLGELMADAVAAFHDGRTADVDRILDAAGDDRAELLDMVELALTLEGPIQPTADRIAAIADDPVFAPRAWPQILQEARHEQGLQRATVIERLAATLGLTAPAAQAQLRVRYHELETGQIPPAGVTDALLDALGDALGGIRDLLAATRLTPTGPLNPAVSFNRDGFDDLSAIAVEHQLMAMDIPEPTPDEQRVDELFGL